MIIRWCSKIWMNCHKKKTFFNTTHQKIRKKTHWKPAYYAAHLHTQIQKETHKNTLFWYYTTYCENDWLLSLWYIYATGGSCHSKKEAASLFDSDPIYRDDDFWRQNTNHEMHNMSAAVIIIVNELSCQSK